MTDRLQGLKAVISARLLILGVLLLIAAALAACGGDGGEDPTPRPERTRADAEPGATERATARPGSTEQAEPTGQGVLGRIGAQPTTETGATDEAGGALSRLGVPGSDDGVSKGPKFTSIATGNDFSCGVRDDGAISCWGSNEYDLSTPPKGEFKEVRASKELFSGAVCGLGTEGTITCWGNVFGEPPSGEFTSFSLGSLHGCGVRTDASVVCWGVNRHGEASPPSGELLL